MSEIEFIVIVFNKDQRLLTICFALSIITAAIMLSVMYNKDKIELEPSLIFCKILWELESAEENAEMERGNVR
ncbi:hypothetical protein AUK11_03220 [bacterium CG2_30_37_16]|nr:MAG: hypothetical protein AUK11_03220 [bacterium CG2_30_37_16]PIP30879.1 MAG: hypothetical protein COX25_02425 [bacterium (Candidatus Howlettbacteria) CG23_combo_of_CG06-09_8_20_14_all_37_9]PJB07468.1 MAG: hypothetical protein CO123_00075 [bacterium (Candidatus Howlettbacteria) CG_4_9_14_3_um_filter_37_10]